MIRILFLSLSLSLICCINAVETAKIAGPIGAVIDPGVYGEAICMNGIIFYMSEGDTPQPILLKMDGIGFVGKAYPDRGASRILVKVERMVTVSNDGQFKEKVVDGYLQDTDGKPGLKADFSLAENAHILKPGTTGKMVFLLSVSAN